MNHIIIIGNLTKDPVSRKTKDGKDVCDFTVAVNRRRKNANGETEADFFRVSAWGAMGQSCQKYLAKGKKVSVTGSISVSTYTAQDGTTRASMDIFAQDVEFLTPSGNGQGGGTNAAAANEPTPVEVEDGELPF